MIKNDINLVFKRKTKQYSPKSLAITIVAVTVIGVGVFFGITLPTKNLAATKKAVTNLENEIAQYSALAMSSGETDEMSEVPADLTLETVLIIKSEKLSSLNEQLDGLKLISTAESNALAYIYAIEESIPGEINIGNLIMNGQTLEIIGISYDDTSLATFCLRLRETGMFTDVFVSTSMVRFPGEKSAIFTISAELIESLDAMPVPQDESVAADNGGNQ
ncbi:MAG: PilN domain-containing protein [Clostridia bacterium]|jgi:Tfp pilus assembly protein PilN|nr:PilN domain-containing protein [Clostridia bacterium]